jgi:hypothetical protein
VLFFSGVNSVVCPYNDATVFVKLQPTEGSTKTLSNPVFWTQAGGSNAEFWNNLAIDDGAAFKAYRDTAATGKLEAELWNNEGKSIDISKLIIRRVLFFRHLFYRW